MANNFAKFLTFEDNEHIRVVNYINDKLSEVMAFHIPSEGKRSAYERFKYSLMGAKKGLPDFIFLHATYKDKEVIYHGLAIELKSQEHKRIILKGKKAGTVVKTKGKLGDEQKIVLAKLNDIGYKAVCCFGSDEAITVIKEYFKEYLEQQKQI